MLVINRPFQSGRISVMIALFKLIFKLLRVNKMKYKEINKSLYQLISYLIKISFLNSPWFLITLFVFFLSSVGRLAGIGGKFVFWNTSGNIVCNVDERESSWPSHLIILKIFFILYSLRIYDKRSNEHYIRSRWEIDLQYRHYNREINDKWPTYQ